MLFLLILVCFFISGLTGLVYEVLWTRMIVEIIGTSPFSVTIVLTVFMAGLGFGSWLAGRMIDRIKQPEKLIRVYGCLELAVGAYCLILPLLLSGFKPVYAVLYNRLFSYFIPYNLLTLIGCLLLLILPVACMGATLPVLSRFFVTSLSRVGTHVGRLYGLNTIGAAAGSLLCGFWLINTLGVWGVLTTAIVLNAAIGGVCVWVGFSQAGKIAAPEEHEPSLKAAGQKASGKKTVKLRETAIAPVPMKLILAVFAVSGFCAMAYEVFWTKLLGLLVGPTTYSFTVVLVTFITGIALGSMFWGRLGDRSRNPVFLLSITQICAALAALLFSQVMGNSQIFFAKLIYEFQDNFVELHLLKGLFLFGFMFLTTFFLGAAFPLVGKIYTCSLAGTGRSIGYAYAVNSIGAVLGSFCAGFVLIPLLGKENGIRLVVFLQLLAALSLLLKAAYFQSSQKTSFRRYIPIAASAAGILLLIFFPRWDRVMLSIGKYHRFDRPEIAKMGWTQALFSWERFFPDLKSGKLLFYGDGIGGFTTVLESTGLMGDVNYNLCNSGKPDASSSRDMDTQTLLAHFALLYHPNPEDALVIGLGSGITAGEILHYPVKRLDVVEINKQVVDASRFFLPWNNNVLENPRARLIVQDGRAHLALSERKYDLITSEPSNPWMSGIAALYTKDFFDLVAARLKPGGLFVQWIPAYQMDRESFNLIGRTFSAAFPDSLMVSTNPARPSSFLFVGSNGKIELDINTATRNLRYAQASKNVVLRNPGLFYSLIVNDKLSALFGDGPINTDNRPLLEYLAPRTMYETDAAIIRGIGLSIGSGLSENVAALQKANQADVDSQIDYAEYFLSFRGGGSEMLQYAVNTVTATPAQKTRYLDIVENFCSANLVSDFYALYDMEAREKCFQRQKETLTAQLGVGSRDADLYEQLGQISLQNQRVDQAAEYFLKEIALRPGDETARNNLGVAYLTSQQYDKAAEQFAEALRVNPDYAHAHANMGIALASRGNSGLDDAIRHYRDALRLDPADADTYNNLGSALMIQGKIDEAGVYFSRALQIRPDFANARYNLQRIAAMQGRNPDDFR